MIPQIKIFADASSVQEIRSYSLKTWISGFTTNPTLMRKSGVTDYKTFAIEAIDAAGGKSLSLEVVADDLPSMLKQGQILGSWGANVVIKIPITTTTGESCLPVVRSLLDDGLAVNVTAMMTDDHLQDLLDITESADTVIASVFAGRIADTGIDPVPIMSRYADSVSSVEGCQLLWASPREVLNILQASHCGCDIITVTPDLLRKLSGFGRDLHEFSLETVRMFYRDATSAGLSINQ